MFPFEIVYTIEILNLRPLIPFEKCLLLLLMLKFVHSSAAVSECVLAVRKRNQLITLFRLLETTRTHTWPNCRNRQQ